MSGPSHDMRCTFVAGPIRCEYPCSLFINGARSGWCVFHRQPLQAGEGAEIARQSCSVPYEQALQALRGKASDSPSVRATRAAMAARVGGVA